MADRVATWVEQYGSPRPSKTIISDADSSPEIEILKQRYQPPKQQQRHPQQQSSRFVDLTSDSPSPPAKKKAPSYGINKAPSKMNDRPPSYENSVLYSPPSHRYQLSPERSKTTSTMNAKQRALALIQSESQKKGIPLGSPKPPSIYTVPHSERPPPIDLTRREKNEDDVIDFDSIRVDPSEAFPADHEVALKDLVQEIYATMDEVDTTEADPEGLTCKLLPHQVTGVQWLRSRETGKKRGGILADDMGLGKTVQSIALMIANPPKRRDANGKRIPGVARGTLIVAPLALIEQWDAEIAAKVDDQVKLKVYLHHGPSRTKESAKLEKYDVVITTYSTVSSEHYDPAAEEKKANKKTTGKGAKTAQNSDDDSDAIGASIVKTKKKGGKIPESGPLFQAKFHRIILDEAHTIKNRATKTAKACFELQGKYRWCLTGTPMQNKVDDFFSLFKFMGPAVVAPMNQWDSFKSKIADPMSKERGAGIAMKRLQAILKLIMLRRTKNTLHEGKPLITLPERNVVEVITDFLDQDERTFYTALKEKADLQLNKFLKAGTVLNNYMSVLTLLLRLRQACSHPALVAGGIDKDALEIRAPLPATSKNGEVEKLEDLDGDIDDLANALGGIGLSSVKTCIVCTKDLLPGSWNEADGRYCKGCKYEIELYAGLQFSTKIKKTIELLEQIQEKREDGAKKSIIFSQFTQFFDLLVPFLKRAGIKYVIYTGAMKNDAREESLYKIRNKDKYTVILVSLKCGALGLNLTCCSNVFVTDCWWNGAIEDQAIDRAHRFGQKHAVQVYKIMIQDTIEENILILQKKKKDMADHAIDGKGGKLTKLSQAEIMMLFGRGPEA